MTPLVDRHPSSPKTPPDIQYFPIVEFKLADWMPLPDSVADLSIADLLPAHSPARSIAIGLQAEPLYAADSLTTLDQLVARAQGIDPSYRPPNFQRVLRVRTNSVNDAHTLAEALQAAPGIDFAVVQHLVPLPQVQPADDPLAALQVQHDPPTLGINARAAWQAGADGSAVSIVDLEHGFYPHNAVPAPTVVYLFPGTPILFGEHGTAVLGILSEIDDGQGGVGIAPRSSVRFAARYGPTTADEHLGDALPAAMSSLAYGDVLLIEQQESKTVAGDAFYVPIEVNPILQLKLPLMMTLGIIVIEPAGNASHDLATVITGDSGAIIVGGVDPVTNTRLDNDYRSNFGSRVNCHARYKGIVTTGWLADLSGATALGTAYTGQFYGTSATSAIIAGAACLLQSYVVKTLGYRLTPARMRTLLSTMGQLSTNPAVDRVGVMPDLAECFAEIDKEPPFWIRNALLEGRGVSRGEWGTCPDIRVVPRPLPEPALPPPFPKPPPGPRRLHIHVRTAYDGDSTARDVSARVYLAPAVTLPRTGDWTLIGHAWIGDVPNDGAFHENEAPLVWDTTDEAIMRGYTLIAIVESRRWRGQAKEGIRTAAELERFFTRNRNVGVLTVLAPGRRMPARPALLSFAFQIESGPDGESPTEVLVRHDLPSRIRVQLVMPAALAPDAIADSDGFVRFDVDRLEPLTLAVHTNSGRVGHCVLEVEPREGAMPTEGEFTVVQRVGNGPMRRTIGRIPTLSEEVCEPIHA